MHDDGNKTARSEGEWTRALEEIRSAPWQLQFAFQPIFDLTRTTVWGYEALARFSLPPVEGPEAWFAAAGRHDVAGALEGYAVRLALRSLAMLPRSARLALNVTPTSLALPDVLEAFSEAPSLKRVVVELTEQAPIHDYARVREAVEVLRRAGASIAIDDVGSGHSGLRHVTELDPDFVKLDRPLIARLGTGASAAAVIEAVAHMCDRIGARAIAEGVERTSELHTLLELGVSLAQGYLIGLPQSKPAAEAATASLSNR